MNLFFLNYGSALKRQDFCNSFNSSTENSFKIKKVVELGLVQIKRMENYRRVAFLVSSFPEAKPRTLPAAGQPRKPRALLHALERELPTDQLGLAIELKNLS